MENQHTDSQASWGKALLILGALPSGLLCLGAILLGLIGLIRGLSPISGIDLGAAFGWAFAIVLLPSGLLIMLLLILSRLNRRIPAIIGSAGNLLIAYIGLIILLLSDLQNRIDTAPQFAFFSAIFLITALSGFIGWALKGLIGRRWIIFSGIAGLILVIGFTLIAALSLLQLNASRQILEGHTVSVREVAWSPDGAYLASADRDGRIIIWDTHSLQRVDRDDLSGRDLAWSPDVETLAASLEGNVVIWDGQTRTLPGTFDAIHHLAWSPDATRLAALVDDQTIVIWDVEPGEEVSRLSKRWFTVLGAAIYWSPDGRIIAYEKVKKLVILWDPDTGQWEEILSGIDDTRVRVASWSPDQTRPAVATWDNAITIWAATGEPPLILEGYDSAVNNLIWSPNGQTIAASSWDNVLFWDATTGKLTRTIRSHTGGVWQIAWSPDGETLATANQDGTIMLWAVGPF